MAVQEPRAIWPRPDDESGGAAPNPHQEAIRLRQDPPVQLATSLLSVLA